MLFALSLVFRGPVNARSCCDKTRADAQASRIGHVEEAAKLCSWNFPGEPYIHNLAAQGMQKFG
jgi:hypothetical protein